MGTLIEDLEQRGLLASTLVVLATEFGRSPRINENAGRDHHPGVFSCVLAGAGVKGAWYTAPPTNAAIALIRTPSQSMILIQQLLQPAVFRTTRSFTLPTVGPSKSAGEANRLRPCWPNDYRNRSTLCLWIGLEPT